jgi:hypothetical protein
MTPLLIVLIVLAIIFDFLNGVHDSSNIVATMISSRAIQPRAAWRSLPLRSSADLYLWRRGRKYDRS